MDVYWKYSYDISILWGERRQLVLWTKHAACQLLPKAQYHPWPFTLCAILVPFDVQVEKYRTPCNWPLATGKVSSWIILWMICLDRIWRIPSWSGLWNLILGTWSWNKWCLSLSFIAPWKDGRISHLSVYGTLRNHKKCISSSRAIFQIYLCFASGLHCIVQTYWI